MDDALGVLIVLAIILLFLFAFRGVVLWFWRINEQMDVLNKINSNLEKLNKKVSKLQSTVNALSPDEESPEVKTDPAPTSASTPVTDSDIPEM